MKFLKGYIFLVLILMVTFMFGTSVFAYNDLTQDHWAYTAVNVMRERGILNGYPDGNFYPEQNVTREEFAKIVVNTLELTSQSAYLDYEDIEDAAQCLIKQIPYAGFGEE